MPIKRWYNLTQDKWDADRFFRYDRKVISRVTCRTSREAGGAGGQVIWHGVTSSDTVFLYERRVTLRREREARAVDPVQVKKRAVSREHSYRGSCQLMGQLEWVLKIGCIWDHQKGVLSRSELRGRIRLDLVCWSVMSSTSSYNIIHSCKLGYATRQRLIRNCWQWSKG